MLVSATQQCKLVIIIHTSSPSLSPLPSPHPIPPGHHTVPDWAPCATQQLLTSNPSYTWQGVYVDSILSICTTLSFPHRSTGPLSTSLSPSLEYEVVVHSSMDCPQHQGISHSRTVQILAEQTSWDKRFE